MATPYPWLNPFYLMPSIATGSAMNYPVELLYSPTEVALLQVERYFRGSTTPIRFNIFSEGDDFDFDEGLYEARVWNSGTPGTVTVYSVANANMTGDAGTKAIMIFPTTDETELWGLTGSLRIQLCEVGVGHKKVLANVSLDVELSLDG